MAPKVEQPKTEGLDGWIPSNDPFEGRFADVDSEKASDAINKRLSKSCNQPYSTNMTDKM